MRASHRTLSEHRPLRRSLAEKNRQLRDLRETLMHLKPQTTPALRESIRRRIHELTEELQAAPDHDITGSRPHHRVYALYAD